MFLIGLLLFLMCVGFGVYSAISTKDGELSGFSIGRMIPATLLGIVLLALSSAFATVDAGSVGVVKRWGQPVREMTPGLHLLTPFAETLTVIPVQTRIIKPKEEAASHDLQMVTAEVTLAYHLDPKFATFFLVELNNDVETRIIQPSVLESIKSITAQYDAQQLISERRVVRDGIEKAIETKLLSYHVIPEQVSITNFSFSPEFNRAIEQKVTAQQNAEKAKNDLVRIQTEADQKVATAEGEAKALKAQKDQITPELLQLRTIEMLSKSWDGKLPQTVISGGNGGAIPFLDVLKAAGK